MADISAKTAVSTITNDLKARSATDALSAEMSSSQFLDVMMARLTALGSDDQDLKHIAKGLNADGNVRDANVLKQLKGLRDKSNARAEAAEHPQDVKLQIKEKIKARINEIASKDDLPVKDDAPLKTLQKVADFLIQADNEGAIDLPPELLQKLNDFLAKGDDLKAFDIANFMRDFSESFKSLMISMNQSAENGMKWPQDLVDQLKELKLGGIADANKDINIYDAVRILKALVNSSEKAAIATLNEKVKNALLPQGRAEIMVNAAAKDNAKSATKNAAENLSAAVDISASIAVASADAHKETIKKADGELKLPMGSASVADPRADVKAKDVAAPSVSPNVNAALRAEIIAAGADAKAVAGMNGVTNAVANNSLLEGLTNVSGNSSARFSAAMNAAAQVAAHQPSEATQQVIVQLQQRGNKTGSLSLQLTPAELGRVDVRLTTHRDGSVHAVIAADKPETLALLQKDASQLERALQQAGLNANTANMSFNLREQRQSHQFDQGRKRFARSEIEETSTKEVALTVNQQGIFSNDRVNYHA